MPLTYASWHMAVVQRLAQAVIVCVLAYISCGMPGPEPPWGVSHAHCAAHGVGTSTAVENLVVQAGMRGVAASWQGPYTCARGQLRSACVPTVAGRGPRAAQGVNELPVSLSTSGGALADLER